MQPGECGERIKLRRAANGLAQKELAEKWRYRSPSFLNGKSVSKNRVLSRFRSLTRSWAICLHLKPHPPMAKVPHLLGCGFAQRVKRNLTVNELANKTHVSTATTRRSARDDNLYSMIMASLATETCGAADPKEARPIPSSPGNFTRYGT